MAEEGAGEPQRTADNLPELLAEVVRDQFQAHPALARSNGDHSRDGEVAEPAALSRPRRVGRLRELEARLGRAGAGADPGLRLDLDMARGIVAGELFELEVRRRPFTDPTVLLDSESPLDVGSYLLRDYAPLEERVVPLCSQLEQSRDWVEAALGELEPSLGRPLLELARQGADGQRSFLREDVRAVLGSLPQGQLRRRLEAALESGEAALDRVQEGLDERLPEANQSFALGAAGLERMLEVQEGLRRTVAEMRIEIDAELESLSEQRDRLLAEHFPGKSVEEVRRAQEADHFTRERLLPSTADLVEELGQFVERHGEVPIPDGPRCQVCASPGFLSAWVSAAYEGAGLLEQTELPCLYYVTTPQTSWPPEEAEEWLRYMNRPTLKNTTVHEVFPGHHVQYLYSRSIRSDLRRFFWTPGFGEGWAHYAEQLLVEAGLADGDPMLELSQNEDALLRACRYRTTLGLHAEGWQVEDGTRLFMERIGMEELPAHREAARGTFDPLYLVYTMGKLRILSWRERWLREGRGDLRSFHRHILSAGSPPLAALERWLQST